MGGIVAAEVVDERRDFALELDVKGFDDVQTAVARLPCNYPVDVGFVVHADAERLISVNVAVSLRTEKRELRTERIATGRVSFLISPFSGLVKDNFSSTSNLQLNWDILPFTVIRHITGTSPLFFGALRLR